MKSLDDSNVIQIYRCYQWILQQSSVDYDFINDFCELIHL